MTGTYDVTRICRHARQAKIMLILLILELINVRPQLKVKKEQPVAWITLAH